MSFTTWRIVQAKLEPDAFSGEGARLYGGRWNHKGTRIVYTASTLSLATLEILVHLEAPHLLGHYAQIPVNLNPSLCQSLKIEQLPFDWASHPAPVSTKDIGSRWANKAESAVLAVPSVIIPNELIFLINPEHPDFKQIKIGKSSRFDFDPRLLS